MLLKKKASMGKLEGPLGFLANNFFFAESKHATSMTLDFVAKENISVVSHSLSTKRMLPCWIITFKGTLYDKQIYTIVIIK